MKIQPKPPGVLMNRSTPPGLIIPSRLSFDFRVSIGKRKAAGSVVVTRRVIKVESGLLRSARITRHVGKTVAIIDPIFFWKAFARDFSELGFPMELRA
jgi:hypothetical protein